ncbi:MAG TPA: universal stress protein, partial [Longimicrobiales bacterium]|nr:universal stress protein [Longimicrobiales bacterium]
MKILLPTDGSRYALTAARMLAGWFTRPGMEVHLLTVVPRMSRSPHRSYGQRRELAAQWKHEARGWLVQTAAPLESQGMRVKTHLRTGNPREVVVHWAEEGYDLVVVGARGRGDSPFFDVGSVALSVLEHAPAPVLMVRAREGGRTRLPDAMHPLRVLLAVDEGLPARRAVEMLPDLLTLDHVQVTALAVADAGTGGPLPEATARHLATRAAKELDDHGMEAVPRLEVGPAAPAIAEAAEEADLVVLGSRAVERVEERHMGSVAQEVAR